jgi:hypothetical protein
MGNTQTKTVKLESLQDKIAEMQDYLEGIIDRLDRLADDEVALLDLTDENLEEMSYTADRTQEGIVDFDLMVEDIILEL